jgi:membrane-associated phospholipid phosphatase
MSNHEQPARLPDEAERSSADVLAKRGRPAWPRHVLAGGMATGLCLALFGFLAAGVATESELDRLDKHVAHDLRQLGQQAPTTVAVFRYVTELGGRYTLILISAVLCVYLVVRRHWLLLAVWLTTLLAGAGLNEILKHVFERTRPEGAAVSGYSFPSGHSMNSAVAYGMLTYLVILESAGGWRRRLSTIVLVLLILAVGFSRMVLGAHYLSDVLGGFAAGAAVVALSVTITETYRCRAAAAEPSSAR